MVEVAAAKEGDGARADAACEMPSDLVLTADDDELYGADRSRGGAEAAPAAFDDAPADENEEILD